MKRRKKLAFVHKANILKLTDGIFKQAVLNIAKQYPGVELEDIHVDAATMQFIRRPESFDVVVATNLYGDILTDEAGSPSRWLRCRGGGKSGTTMACSSLLAFCTKVHWTKQGKTRSL